MIAPLESEALPAYLPARMLNEFVYCPRLFYYEWVEGIFAHNQETVEGALRHQKLERKEDELPDAERAAQAGDTIHSRSVMLSSDTHRLIAKLDLVEGTGNSVTPIDYKRGAPREKDREGQLSAWDADRVQIAVQALVLRDNGYCCNEGILYYVATKQRVRVPIDDELIRYTLAAVEQAWKMAETGRIPPPLEDSPKCPRCSLVGICLPDETRACSGGDPAEVLTHQLRMFDLEPEPVGDQSHDKWSAHSVRRLVPARDDLRPLYLNTQGLHVGKTGQVLKVKEKDKVVQEVRLNEICQLNLFGNIQLSTQAVQALCEAEIPIGYFSMGGWFYGATHGLGVKNIFLRREQFRWADIPSFCLRLARSLVSGKIRNQRTLLQRNHVEPPPTPLALMKCLQEDAERAESLEQLLGIEGNAARIYFENFPGMLKVGQTEVPSDDLALATTKSSAARLNFNFQNRNRRPPRDPVNALLSLAYSMLAKDLMIVCQTVGFDPYLGFFHQPRFGRASLALDLMEPFRPLIADSAILTAINTRMITSRDFLQAGSAVALKPEARKAFFHAYEQRMDALATHPLFGYRVSYRRLLEIQTRLLARVLTGEMLSYPVFVTR